MTYLSGIASPWAMSLASGRNNSATDAHSMTNKSTWISNSQFLHTLQRIRSICFVMTGSSSATAILNIIPPSSENFFHYIFPYYKNSAIRCKSQTIVLLIHADELPQFLPHLLNRLKVDSRNPESLRCFHIHQGIVNKHTLLRLNIALL